MIEVVARDGEPEALLCPALICDACRKQVAGPGNLLWAVRRPEGGKRQSSPAFVAHKGRCDQVVKKILANLYPLADGWTEQWDEAGSFLAYLTSNTSKPFADDPDGNYLDHELVQPGGQVLSNLQLRER